MKLLAALVLVAVAATGSAAPPCRSGLPPGFLVDGVLDEWRNSPSFSVGPTSLVAGNERVSSAEDASATAWLAIGVEGLAIAVRVRDDVVRFPSAADGLASDHVELHVAFAVPPIDAPSWECTDDVMRWPEGDREAQLRDCLALLHEVELQIAKLADDFHARYALSAAGAIRLGPDPAVGAFASARDDDGYRLEALLPLSMLPRTGEAPLRHIRLVLDVVDADDANQREPAILSSEPGRDPANPATFDVLTLAPPIRYGAWPDWLERVMAVAHTSCRPAADVGTVESWFESRWYPGHEYGPKTLLVGTIDVARAESLGSLGGVELVHVESDAQHGETALASRRGMSILDWEPSLGDFHDGGFEVTVRVANRGTALDALLFASGDEARFGQRFIVALVTMDAKGRLSARRQLVEVDHDDISWTSDDALTKVQLWADRGKEKALRATLLHDSKRGTYDVALEPQSLE